MNPLDIEDLNLLVFLFKEVGLRWELLISHSPNLTSFRDNANLFQFLRRYQIILHVVNSGNIPQHVEFTNVFYFTKTKYNTTGGFLKHLRNSIMHGNFRLDNIGNENIITFWDRNRNKYTMSGKITVKLLKELMLNI